MISGIVENLSGIKYAFHPSYFCKDASEVQLEAWKHLIHIHIQKCAGENFYKPLLELIQYLKSTSQNTKKHFHNAAQNTKVEYLWHSSGQGSQRKWQYDAFLRMFCQGKMLNNIQGSFFSNHSSPFGPYEKKFLEQGISTKKICLVRDPSDRLYSHLRFIARTLNQREALIDISEVKKSQTHGPLYI